MSKDGTSNQSKIARSAHNSLYGATATKTLGQFSAYFVRTQGRTHWQSSLLLRSLSTLHVSFSSLDDYWFPLQTSPDDNSPPGHLFSPSLPCSLFCL